MKIVITGSLGHISKPLTEELVQKGNEVTVISSKANKQKDIQALGAKAAIGSVQDVDFLTSIFKGADAVYCMIPPANYLDPNIDLKVYVLRIAENYSEAIQQSGVKRVVFLSSIGAHLAEGNGIIQDYHEMEGILNKLKGVDITFMRPTSFYYNLLGYMPMAKLGFIAVNYGDNKIVWVSPKDIAAAIADEIQTPFKGKKVRYVASDERTGIETAAVLGKAIGKPELKWTVVSDEQSQKGLEAAGLQPAIAAGLVEMYSGIQTGKFWEDYEKHKPEMGRVKLEEFANDFAEAFRNGVSRDH
ncbi:MAG TPA: NAD(P)H-binding protein [Puia sp.]